MFWIITVMIGFLLFGFLLLFGYGLCCAAKLGDMEDTN
jgi:hypothetical protein